MSEANDRCQYWPQCSIHLGQPRSRSFSTSNIAEMWELRRQGETLAEIAEAFDSHINYIARLTTRRP